MMLYLQQVCHWRPLSGQVSFRFAQLYLMAPLHEYIIYLYCFKCSKNYMTIFRVGYFLWRGDKSCFTVLWFEIGFLLRNVIWHIFPFLLFFLSFQSLDFINDAISNKWLYKYWQEVPLATLVMVYLVIPYYSGNNYCFFNMGRFQKSIFGGIAPVCNVSHLSPEDLISPVILLNHWYKSVSYCTRVQLLKAGLHRCEYLSHLDHEKV